jgi:predicted branched-subunit amino acid permease
MAPYLQKLPIRWKLFLAYLLTDEAYAVSIVHYQEDSDQRYKYWFFFGAGLTLWTTWQLSTAAGIFLGTSIPTSWSLDFTLALIFIAIVIPSIKDKASLAAALAAGVAAVILFNFPLKTGLLLASLVGITVGMVIEARS